MNELKDNTQSAFVNDDNLVNKPTKAVPAPQPNISIDTSNNLFDNILNAYDVGKIDMSEIESFSQISQNRNQIYQLLDSMGEDSTIAAILETYAEDATEYNDNGQIVWCESSKPEIAKYVTYLLQTMNVDKNVYKWIYSLCKYGDLYLRLFRESEYDDPIFKTQKETSDERKNLKEDVNIKSYSKNDRYVHYIEAVSNPAEMFELTRFGKTSGYIQAEVNTASVRDRQFQNSHYRYAFKKGDINIYSATDFVHACLEDNSSRVPEGVDIFLDDDGKDKKDTNVSYTVKRGQSLLYSPFKIWRELMLLENSVLLNRITKSSIVRMINVEVGSMAKESIGPHLAGIKQMIEQKSAIREGQSLSEYTNPGPMENNIYIPTHNGVGAISTTQVGGDVDVRSLADLDYFKNKFFGACRIPKQYFGETDDAAGFSGGESLSIISARYGKMIKRIQNTMVQALTDAVNLMLLDKGLSMYVNKFNIKMLPPTTQEEIDRRESTSNKVAVVQDIMNILSDIDEQSAKLKILKSLLSGIVSDSEILEVIQQLIDKLEQSSENISVVDEPVDDIDMNDSSISTSGSSEIEVPDDMQDNTANSTDDTGTKSTDSPEVGETGETILPLPSDLGADFTDSTQF